MLRALRNYAFLVGLWWSAIGSMALAEFPHGVVGVSLAGAEFGVESESFSNENSGEVGVAYTFNSSDSIEYFSSHGIKLIRIPFRWERIQPRLGKPLNAAHLRALKILCRAAGKADVKVILDVHNYGRYRTDVDGLPRDCIIDEEVRGRTPVTRDDLADLWIRLATAFRRERAVVGYGLMNEPHDMGGSDWKAISQTVVDGIRRIDRETAVVVAGDDWSSAERFFKANGKRPWIKDPANIVVYEAHCYFDSDGSGKYQRTYRSESLESDVEQRGLDRIRPFLKWCKKNKVHGFVGEFGAPADSAWRNVTQSVVEECIHYEVSACIWAAGEWWGDYPLSVQPTDEFRSHAPQLRWLKEAARQRPRIRIRVLED